MSVSFEAFYIFDNQGCLLEHTYNGRPPTAKDLLLQLRNHTPPWPAVLHLPDLNPPSNLYSIFHGNLTLICTSSKDMPPQALIDFLHRLVDVFEDFLGSPLISAKIEENYEVVAQLLVEMCDGGIISNTEANALREQVEVSSSLGKLFAQVGLPSASPSVGPTILAATLKAASSAANGPAIPWRKSNIRHTSNELYVDIVESLSAVYTPSGRVISARSHGSVLLTAKISGIPDLLLTLSAPGGTSSSKSAGLSRTIQLPTFHPCVRLSRWRDSPGELSFIPPDGKFMLASYETDLSPSSLNSAEPPSTSERMFLPVSPDLRTSLGRNGNDFEAQVTLNNAFPGAPPPTKPGPSSRVGSNTAPFSFGTASGSSTSNAPTLEAVLIHIPFPPEVRNVTELKPSRGDATFNLSSKTVEWKIPTKDGFSVSGVATLTGTVSGPFGGDDKAANENTRTLSEYYDNEALGVHEGAEHVNGDREEQSRQGRGNKALMPRSITASFSVKGWLASGIKVQSLVVDTKKSKGLGEGVKPYKGVKYMTVSKRGVERRVE